MEKILNQIQLLAKEIGKEVNLMEVCGTHTQVISRSGIRQIMPQNIHLLTGPGCPVCVTAQKDIDAIVSLALAGTPIATYGDVLRVPGRFGSLNQARENGALVFDVYAVQDALKLKKQYPNLVFFAIGFETTAPMTAWAIKQGLTVYSTHKVFVPAMQALLQMGEIKIDGFINPGHVSAIIGTEPYKIMPVPQVIAGFEPKDVLEAILMLLRQIKEGRCDVENQYSRVVKKQGNLLAQKEIFDVLEIFGADWRGFGKISKSGLEIKGEYKKFDAKIKYKNILDKIDFSQSADSTGCRCGEVLRGLVLPNQCPLFGKLCQPDNPVGPCMVSVEGACNVFWRYK